MLQFVGRRSVKPAVLKDMLTEGLFDPYNIQRLKWSIYRWPQLPEGNWTTGNNKNQSFAIYFAHTHTNICNYCIYLYMYISMHIYCEREREWELIWKNTFFDFKRGVGGQGICPFSWCFGRKKTASDKTLSPSFGVEKRPYLAMNVHSLWHG